MTRTSLLLLAAAVTLSACKKQHPIETTDQVPTASEAVATAPANVDEAVDQMVYNFNRVHFEYDSSALDDASKKSLTANCQIMQKFPSVTVEVQGHADERGTVEYNLALGQRRAESVRTWMTAMGVPPTRVRTVSYGEEVPVATGHTETAWSQNRRAEFRILSGTTPQVQGTVD
jgi:peptidoglycan-associated lipoprotein